MRTTARVLCGTILALAAGTAAAWTPGGEYAAGGTTSTNPVYNPFLGNPLPLNRNISVVGAIHSNDIAIFTDLSGRFVRGTNVYDQIKAWGIEGALAAISNANAEAQARFALIEAETNDWRAAYGWGDHALAGYLTAETDPLAGPRLALIEAETNDWRAAYGWGDHALAGYLAASAWQSWLGTNTYVKAEQDAVALAALATQRVERVWSPDATEYRDGTGGVWRIYDSGSTTGWVAVIPDIPEEIVMPGLEFPVASVWEGSDWDWSMTIEATGYPNVYDASFSYLGFGSWSSVVTSTVLPMLLQPYDGSGATQPVALDWRGTVATQHVGTVALESSLTGLASRADVSGIVYSNSVSQMVVWTNAAGAATNWAYRESGVWRTNSFGAGTEGAITNGSGNLTFNAGNVFRGNQVLQDDDAASPNQQLLTFRTFGGATTGYIRDDGGIYTSAHVTTDNRTAGLVDLSLNPGANVPGLALGALGMIGWSPDWFWQAEDTVIRRISPGLVGIGTKRDNTLGSIVCNTNTAAEVRTNGGIIMPHYGTNTIVRLIFTNGTMQAWEVAQ